MSFPVTDISQFLIRILNDRRAFVRIDRRDLFYHFCDLLRVVNDHFSCLCRSKIGKFFHHLIGCPQEQRWLGIRIIKSFSRHDDPSVDFILRVKEMHITRSHDRLFELLTQFYDLPVDLLQILL